MLIILYVDNVADVCCDGINTGEAMAARGYAWTYEKFIGNKGDYRESHSKAS